MTRRALALAAALAWVTLGAIGGAGINAHFRCTTLAELMTARRANENFFFAVLGGVMMGPTGFVASTIVSAGFYDGLSFSRAPWSSPEERKASCGA